MHIRIESEFVKAPLKKQYIIAAITLLHDIWESRIGVEIVHHYAVNSARLIQVMGSLKKLNGSFKRRIKSGRGLVGTKVPKIHHFALNLCYFVALITQYEERLV